MTDNAATIRKKIFEDGGNKFIKHIDNIDDMYTAVMADITSNSFASADPAWSVSNNKFDTNHIMAPVLGTNGVPPRIISNFDNDGVAQVKASSSTVAPMTVNLAEIPIRDFHRAWAGDEMAYIDRVASTLFMSLNKEE
jgi:hypothetical protein